MVHGHSPIAVLQYIVFLTVSNLAMFFCICFSGEMANTNHVVYAILKFLDDQQRSPDLAPDAIESLEGKQ